MQRKKDNGIQAESLFSFMASTRQEHLGNDIEEEVANYLFHDCTDVGMLQEFPQVLRAFTKFNAALPSSAEVEGLFSAAGQILTHRRCRMSDTLFE
jgi:hypothetical protein